jgi:hypothetical protein
MNGITINAVVASLTHTAMSEGVPEPIMRDSVGCQVIHRMPSRTTLPASSSWSLATRPVGSPAKRSWQTPGIPFPSDALLEDDSSAAERRPHASSDETFGRSCSCPG